MLLIVMMYFIDLFLICLLPFRSKVLEYDLIMMKFIVGLLIDIIRLELDPLDFFWLSAIYDELLYITYIEEEDIHCICKNLI